MKLSDYVVDFLAKQGIRHNFLVSGGAVIHIVDSTSKHPSMEYICGQHEEHSAAAADMYARVTRKLGLVSTTSGPGATNIVTSICNAWFDSIPMICLTGQVSRFRIKKRKQLRQKGFQETDIVSIFKSITKYAKLILDPASIRYELEKALHLATEGRPGPVLLDIPDDLQRVEINPEELKGYTPQKKKRVLPLEDTKQLFQMIAQAKRPILILGAGVQSANAAEEALSFAEYFKIPVVTTWGGADAIPHSHELNMGCIGVCGPRGGNFGVQFSDLVIALGTRLSPMVTGGKQNLFAPLSKKVMVDVDMEELNKFDASTFLIDLPILAHLKDFFAACSHVYTHYSDSCSSWRNCIQSWRKRYPIYTPDLEKHQGRIHPHVFVKKISDLAQEGAILIGDTGANISWTMQAFETKKGQRIFSAWNHTPMGYSLPASVGASLASEQEIICFIGDGGLMMCLQELGTIRRHNLPVKIFIFDNKGHGIQKQTIDTWLHSHYAAVDQSTGLYFPNYQQIARAFEIPFYQLQTHEDLSTLHEIWNQKGPFICNVEIIEQQKIVPMLKFGSGIEDLDPKIPKEELQMIANEALQVELAPA